MNNEELAKKHGVYWKYENSLENFCAALTQEKDATIKDLEAHLQELSDASIGLSEKDAEIARLREALECYATCSDGCTCGDGWSHTVAVEALAKKKEDV